MSHGDGSPPSSSVAARDHVPINIPPIEPSVSPDEKLLVHAFRLAVLEKLDQLVLIVVTAVLLAGPSIARDRGADFWNIFLILVMEAMRVFIHKSELEYQALAATARDGEIGALNTKVADKVRNTRIGIVSVLKLIPVMSAMACGGLSITRLLQQGFGFRSVSAKANGAAAALVPCYTVVLLEAALYLVDKMYSRFIRQFILKEISKDMGFSALSGGELVLQRLFFAAFSKFIKGNAFEVDHKMDLVNFLAELLDSGKQDAQLVAVKMLERHTTDKRFRRKTLQNLRESGKAPEQLVEMLSWKSPGQERKIRRCAAVIVMELTVEKQNARRISRIPGAIQAISTLLDTNTQEGRDPCQYDILNSWGLHILKNLISDRDNIEHIHNAHGLMLRIIHFISNASILQTEDCDEQTSNKFGMVLDIVNVLVSAEGTSGKELRKAAIENEVVVSKLHGILVYAPDLHIEMQQVAIQVILSLALDQDAKELIGSTGILVQHLLRIFIPSAPAPRESAGEDLVRLKNLAGEALARLMLGCEDNCITMLWLDPDLIKRLIPVLGDSQLRIHAAMILRNVCAYLPANILEEKLQDIATYYRKVLSPRIDVIMHERDEKLLLEASLGLVYELTSKLKLISGDIFSRDEFAKRLVDILKDYKHPDIEVPRIRRFVIQLATRMMEKYPSYCETFLSHGLDDQLKNVLATTSEREIFHVFSGTVGIMKHRRSMTDLVKEAYAKLHSGTLRRNHDLESVE